MISFPADAADIDWLTRLPNRLYLVQRASEVIALVARRGGSLACLLLDIDGMGQINDAHGHEAGDAVLREVGQRLASTPRDSDLLGRWDGDEFVALVREPPAEAAIVAEKFRAAVSSTPVQLDLFGRRRVVDVRLSVGVALWHPTMEDAYALVAAARSALTRATESGGDRIEFDDWSREVGRGVPDRARRRPETPVDAS